MKNQLREVPKFENIKEIIYNSVKLYPDNIAYTIKEKTEGDKIEYKNVTYTQLLEDINALGTALYAKELQGNKDKYVMKYISEVVKLANKNKLVSLDDLYTKKESDIVEIFKKYFTSWNKFNKANNLICTNDLPHNFYISFDTKKRNAIPLVNTEAGVRRANCVSEKIKTIYEEISSYHDTLYAYVEEIEKV